MVAQSDSDQSAHYLSSMIIMGVLYFIFGFVTWMNSSLILFVKTGYSLDNVGALLVPSAFYLSYFVFALPGAMALRRTGMKKGMSVGLLIMATGAALFAAFMANYSYIGSLVALFVFGAGLAILQTAVNPYVSILGPIESGARRVAMMGICNKAAGFAAPFVLGGTLLAGVAAKANQIDTATTEAIRTTLQQAFVGRAVVPFLVIAGVCVVVAIWVVLSSLPEIKPESNLSNEGQRSIFSYPHLWLGVLALFIYVGAEVMVGDVIVIYGQSMFEQAGMSIGAATDAAKHLTAWTMVAMVVGYFVGVALTPRFISQQVYLALSAVLGVLLTAAVYLTTGHTSIVLLAALGFANAMMWPAIFPLAIKGLGKATAFGSALLIMGIAGGSIIPMAYAGLEKVINFQAAFLLIMVPAYLFILYYGLHGHAVGGAKRKTNDASPAAAEASTL